MSKIERRNKYLTLSSEQILHCLSPLYPNCKISSFVIASSGLANTNYIVTLENREKLVLRIHSNLEFDTGLKEFKISELLTSFPMVPKVLYFQPTTQDAFSYSIIEYIDGTIISEIITNNKNLFETAYFEIGLLLSNLNQLKLNSPGLLDKDLNIIEIRTEENKFYPVTNYIIDCLANENLKRYATKELTTAIYNLIKENDYILHTIEEAPHLVHGDFKIENIMVRSEGSLMHLVGVLDWEHARSDTSYADIATLFRGDYDKNSILKSSFANGYEANGAKLIPNWDYAIKIVDLVNLCSFLCSDDDRSKLYAMVIENLNNTINFIKSSN
jgi:thiamine kinase-like enzyme